MLSKSFKLKILLCTAAALKLVHGSNEEKVEEVPPIVENELTPYDILAEPSPKVHDLSALKGYLTLPDGRRKFCENGLPKDPDTIGDLKIPVEILDIIAQYAVDSEDIYNLWKKNQTINRLSRAIIIGEAMYEGRCYDATCRKRPDAWSKQWCRVRIQVQRDDGLYLEWKKARFTLHDFNHDGEKNLMKIHFRHKCPWGGKLNMWVAYNWPPTSDDVRLIMNHPDLHHQGGELVNPNFVESRLKYIKYHSAATGYKVPDADVVAFQIAMEEAKKKRRKHTGCTGCTIL